MGRVEFCLPGHAEKSTSLQKDSAEADADCDGVKDTPVPKATWSSTVPFYPPSRKYWRIGRKWYDFEPFLELHPGGAHVLKLARDRFEDCTYVFESHHLNYRRVRAIIQKYEVSTQVVEASGLLQRPKRQDQASGKASEQPPCHFDSVLDSGATPELLDDTAFYSQVRTVVDQYLQSIGHRDGGPTLLCCTLFWLNFTCWALAWLGTWYTGRFSCAFVLGILSTILGAFGHNWVHQPRYQWRALLSLDTLGFSSTGWFREHLLQHHMYTNTPWDNHFKGTEPFIVTDPTIQRNLYQRYISPLLVPAVLSVATYGNWFFHLVELCKGNEVLSIGKAFFPVGACALIARWGLRGVFLHMFIHMVLGNWYYTCALMNHNTEQCVDVAARNAAKDWGEAQLLSSADWAVNTSFLGSFRYLWLNFHTVHHLFPRVDVSHHPAIQGILMEECAKHGIVYSCSTFWDTWRQMLKTIANPSSLMQEILVYGNL